MADNKANGFMIITAINSDTGEAGSETYKIVGVTTEGDTEVFLLIDSNGEECKLTEGPR